eukprot:5994960-Amphidinium_carterae.1
MVAIVFKGVQKVIDDVDDDTPFGYLVQKVLEEDGDEPIDDYKYATVVMSTVEDYVSPLVVCHDDGYVYGLSLDAFDKPIDICITPRFPIKFYKVNGEEFEIDYICVYNRVDEVKTLIEYMEMIPPDQQRLIFEGQELKDDRTLLSYGFQEGDTMTIVKSNCVVDT